MRKKKERTVTLTISEAEFRSVLIETLSTYQGFDYVTGPGRSGAIASAYASHFMAIPFVPFKCKIPNKQVLIVDTAMQSGRTLRKASRLYNDGINDGPYACFFNEPPRVRFWYEELSMVRGKGNEYRGRTA